MTSSLMNDEQQQYDAVAIVEWHLSVANDHFFNDVYHASRLHVTIENEEGAPVMDRRQTFAIATAGRSGSSADYDPASSSSSSFPVEEDDGSVACSGRPCGGGATVARSLAGSGIPVPSQPLPLSPPPPPPPPPPMSSGGGGGVITGADACRDFTTNSTGSSSSSSAPRSTSWTHDDCVEVWGRFAGSVPLQMLARKPDVDMFRGTAAELRRNGTPCLATTTATSDGAGSSTIRHLATWIYAEQMGCDWVTPSWGKWTAAGATDGTEL